MVSPGASRQRAAPLPPVTVSGFASPSTTTASAIAAPLASMTTSLALDRAGAPGEADRLVAEAHQRNPSRLVAGCGDLDRRLRVASRVHLDRSACPPRRDRPGATALTPVAGVDVEHPGDARADDRLAVGVEDTKSGHRFRALGRLEATQLDRVDQRLQRVVVWCETWRVGSDPVEAWLGSLEREQTGTVRGGAIDDRLRFAAQATERLGIGIEMAEKLDPRRRRARGIAVKRDPPADDEWLRRRRLRRGQGSCAPSHHQPRQCSARRAFGERMVEKS